MKRFLLSTLVSTVLLFLWSGVTQMLPWGVTTAQNVSVQTSDETATSQVPNLIDLPSGSLTTEAFDSQFIDRVSTYTTDETFSWIVTQPLQENYTGYFIFELITSLVVALLLALLLRLTTPLDLRTRILLVALAALAASAATYGQLMNWWSLPASYGLGVSLNLLIGWTLAGFVSARFIIK